MILFHGFTCSQQDTLTSSSDPVATEKGSTTSLSNTYLIPCAALRSTLSGSKHLASCVLEKWKCSAQKGFEWKTEALSELSTLLTYLLNMLSVVPRVTLLIKMCATVSTPSKTKLILCHFLQKTTYTCKYTYKTVRIPTVNSRQKTHNFKMYISATVGGNCLNYIQKCLTLCVATFISLVKLRWQLKCLKSAAQHVHTATKYQMG